MRKTLDTKKTLFTKSLTPNEKLSMNERKRCDFKKTLQGGIILRVNYFTFYYHEFQGTIYKHIFYQFICLRKHREIIKTRKRFF